MIADYVGKPSSEYLADRELPSQAIKWLSKSYYNPRRGESLSKDKKLTLVFVELDDDVLLLTVMIEKGCTYIEDDPAFWLPDAVGFDSTLEDFERAYGAPLKVGGDETDFLGYINPWAKFRFHGDALIHGEFENGTCMRISYMSERLESRV